MTRDGVTAVTGSMGLADGAELLLLALGSDVRRGSQLIARSNPNELILSVLALAHRLGAELTGGEDQALARKVELLALTERVQAKLASS